MCLGLHGQLCVRVSLVCPGVGSSPQAWVLPTACPCHICVGPLSQENLGRLMNWGRKVGGVSMEGSGRG